MTRQCTRLRVSTQGSVVLLLRGEGGPSGLAVGCRVWSHLGPGCSGSIGRVCRARQAWAPGDGGLTPPRGQLGSMTIRFPPSAWTEELLESSFPNQPLCVGSECPLFSQSWVGGLGALCSGAGLLGLAHGEGLVLGWPHWVGGSERGQSQSGPDCGCFLQSRNQLGEGAGWPLADTITQARTKVCSKDS